MAKTKMPPEMAFAQCVDLITQLLEKYGDDVLTKAEKDPSVQIQKRKSILQTKRMRSYFDGWNGITNKKPPDEADS